MKKVNDIIMWTCIIGLAVALTWAFIYCAKDVFYTAYPYL